MELLDNILKLQKPNLSVDNDLIKLLIEVPHKGKVECVVQPSTTLQSLLLLVIHKLNINDNNPYYFQLNYPRKQFDNLNATIEQVEWEANQKVMMISKN